MVFHGDDQTKEWFEEVMNFFFLIDIVINFLTPYYDNDGEMVFDPWTIA